jgi:uncharacterized protein YhaN
MQTTREALKAAQAEAQKLTAQIAQLEEALDRAKEMAEDAEESLEGFKGLDSAISRFRADAVKRGADPRKLSPELKEQVAQKKSAQEELKQANDTREVLAAELREAKEQQSRIQDRLFPLAAEVVMQEAGALANELTRINERQWELHNVLRGLVYSQHLYAGNWVRVQASPEVSAALRDFDPGQYFGDADPLGKVGRAWGQLISAVIENPDAEVVAPKVPRPADYLPQA